MLWETGLHVTEDPRLRSLAVLESSKGLILNFEAFAKQVDCTECTSNISYCSCLEIRKDKDFPMADKCEHCLFYEYDNNQDFVTKINCTEI